MYSCRCPPPFGKAKQSLSRFSSRTPIVVRVFQMFAARASILLLKFYRWLVHLVDSGVSVRACPLNSRGPLYPARI